MNDQATKGSKPTSRDPYFVLNKRTLPINPVSSQAGEEILPKHLEYREVINLPPPVIHQDTLLSRLQFHIQSESKAEPEDTDK
jgi:hypothetical protein